MRLVLCVDAIMPVLTGIGRYSLELSQGLKGDERVSSLRYWTGSRWIKNPRELQIQMPGSVRRKRLLRKLLAASDSKRFKTHLVHAPNYFLPDRAECGIATIHDLSVFKYPATHPVERVADFNLRFDKTIARADHFIVDSEHMKQELVAFTGLDPARVTVVYLGVSSDYRPRSQAQCHDVLQRYALKYSGYALCVSSFEPRKRIGELISAYSNLPKALRVQRPLVLLGGTGWLNEELHEEIGRAEREGWLKPLGYVNEQDLHILYSGAALFAYPSTYEGFGLPPIEAMASGVPVVAANSSCLPEVTGGAALLVNPDDIDRFSQHLEKALSDGQWREQAIKVGYEVAGRYSWQRCVAETIGVYGHVLNERF